MFLIASCGGGNNSNTVFNVTGTTFEGASYNLSDGTGRPLVLNFWYPSCPPCVVELPDFQRAYEQYGDRVDFLAIFSPFVDDEATARAFVSQIGIQFPVLTDTNAMAQFEYGVTQYPSTFFINAQRTTARRFTGGPIPYSDLETNILSLLDG